MGILEQILERQDLILQKLDEMDWMEDVGDKLLKPAEIKSRLNISDRTFHNKHIELAEFGMRKVGGRWMMRESQLKKYLKSKGIT